WTESNPPQHFKPQHALAAVLVTVLRHVLHDLAIQASRLHPSRDSSGWFAAGAIMYVDITDEAVATRGVVAGIQLRLGSVLDSYAGTSRADAPQRRCFQTGDHPCSISLRIGKPPSRRVPGFSAS